MMIYLRAIFMYTFGLFLVGWCDTKGRAASFCVDVNSTTEGLFVIIFLRNELDLVIFEAIKEQEVDGFIEELIINY